MEKEKKIFGTQEKKIFKIFCVEKKTKNKLNHFYNTKRSDIGQRLGPQKIANEIVHHTLSRNFTFFVYVSLFCLSNFRIFIIVFHFPSLSLLRTSKNEQKSVIFSSLKSSEIVYDGWKSKEFDHKTSVKMIIFRVALKWGKNS